jgi:CRISPR system Cascade subunit CasD
MPCLLLRLQGPLQSWGVTSRLEDRDTAAFPTKSGVVGLICAALGRDRSESPADLAALRMAVRVDSPGIRRSELQTAGGGKWKGAPYRILRAGGGFSTDAVLSTRHYLMDATFLVGFEGDGELLEQVHAALKNPARFLALGRRACPPSEPVFLEDGLRVGPLQSEIASYPFLVPLPKDTSEGQLLLISELDSGDGEAVLDVPVRWPDSLTREYSVRYLSTELLPFPKSSLIEEKT